MGRETGFSTIQSGHSETAEAAKATPPPRQWPEPLSGSSSALDLLGRERRTQGPWEEISAQHPSQTHLELRRKRQEKDTMSKMMVR